MSSPPRPSRRARADATRARIISAAYELFCSVGYAATTMKAIAERAGVAVQTVYFVFHTKPALLSAVTEDTAAGEAEPLPVGLRPWYDEALETLDGRRSLALLVENGVDIYTRVAPLAHAIREAALVDPDVDALWSQISVRRKTAMGQQILALRDHAQLRRDLETSQATDILHALLSHETYLDLVQRSGWKVEPFKAWIYQSLCQLLLAPEALLAPGSRDAVAGLSFAPAN